MQSIAEAHSAGNSREDAIHSRRHLATPHARLPQPTLQEQEIAQPFIILPIAMNQLTKEHVDGAWHTACGSANRDAASTSSGRKLGAKNALGSNQSAGEATGARRQDLATEGRTWPNWLPGTATPGIHSPL